MTRMTVGKGSVEFEFKESDLRILQLRTPVITGQLRDGWQIQDRDIIVNLTPYAGHVEFGTGGRPGQFIIQRSIPEITKNIVNRLMIQLERITLIQGD